MSFFQWSASGLADAIWSEVWQWGLGVGLIILCLALAYFSPFDKKYFILAAAIIAAALFIFARGQLVEKTVCDAKIKYIYLKAHPTITKKNIAKNWIVSPSWQLGDKSTYLTTKKKPACDGPFDTRCWGQ
jgi:hypothetical protein